MDGYVITATGAEAFARFGLPGVRHVAMLDNGQGFVAFDGPVPAEGRTFEVVDVDAFFPFMPKIRRLAITAGTRDRFALYDAGAFRLLPYAEVRMASLVREVGTERDWVLAAVVGSRSTARWSATTVSFLDVRLPLGIAS